MKAENILNSNLTWKSVICYRKLGKNHFFLDFASFSVGFFFSKLKFFENFCKHPPFFFHPRIHKMINYIYIKFDTPSFTTDNVTSDSMSGVLINTPPRPDEG